MLPLDGLWYNTFMDKDIGEEKTARTKIEYEYRFMTTPEFKVIDEDWQLYDVFLKYLDNGAFVFVIAFRRII